MIDSLFNPSAFALGMVALLNPCGFALLPAYLGYFLGLDDDRSGARSTMVALNRAQVIGLSMSAGFLAVFGILGLFLAGSLTAIGQSGWLPRLTIVIGVGLVILGAGLVMGILGAIGNGSESLAADPIAAGEPEPELALDSPPPLTKVRRYAYGFFALAALVAFILPALESADPTLFADTNRQGSLAATGRAVYLQEGCVYCHSQQVRPIVTDVGLGPVSVLGDYANETPVLVGVQRYGPDLMHLGSRQADADAIAAHLQAPRETRPWSIMPQYDYLNVDDLAALAGYLVGEE